MLIHYNPPLESCSRPMPHHDDDISVTEVSPNCCNIIRKLNKEAQQLLKCNNYHMTERTHVPRRPSHFSDYRHKSEAHDKKSRFPLMNHEVNVISSFGRAILFSNLGFNIKPRFCRRSCPQYLSTSSNGQPSS